MTSHTADAGTRAASAASAVASRSDALPSPWARTTAGFGVIVFLASDLMLFAGVFAAYYLLRAETSPWPPPGVELDVVRAGAATLVLIGSSFTLIASERAHRRGDVVGMQRWLALTWVLGAAFLANQLLEYRGLGFGIGTDVYGSVHWTLTGLHTAHVVVGLGALAVLFVRTVRARRAEVISPWVAATSAFWHLVDVVWIGVFLTIWVVR